METLRSCPVCAHPNLLPALRVLDHSITKEPFQLVDCAACGLRFTNPRPTGATLDRYYQSENYISHSNRSATLLDRVYQRVRGYALKAKHSRVAYHQADGRLLDVGCGTGEFLAYCASRGYVVQGIEPSLCAREQAIANHSLSILPQLELLPAQEQFDVITLWHVLEHLPDPRTTFKRLFALMADGGLLAIAVPDRGSWDCAYYRTAWAAWDVPRHLIHYREVDIQKLLREQGFDLVETRRMWLDATYISLLSERYKGRSEVLAWGLGFLVGLWSNIQSLLTKRATSSMLYFARKQNL
jgi:2-polyprenyl-3-methyl-5-hydroxy-6-metoxy-1,4-benzoquinol methylase